MFLVPDDERSVGRAIASGWIAPLGPEVDAFQSEFADAVGAQHAVARASGTAALHLALIDILVVSRFPTFLGSELRRKKRDSFDWNGCYRGTR